MTLLSSTAVCSGPSLDLYEATRPIVPLRRRVGFFAVPVFRFGVATGAAWADHDIVDAEDPWYN